MVDFFNMQIYYQKLYNKKALAINRGLLFYGLDKLFGLSFEGEVGFKFSLSKLTIGL